LRTGRVTFPELPNLETRFGDDAPTESRSFREARLAGPMQDYLAA
jgi:hypothetical protein